MLWRALRDVERGFWIDVGAAHPREYSVTQAFYERGWHGINIEPEPEYAAALRAQRPGDINLQFAAGSKAGRAALQHIVGTGLSTFDSAIAERHAAAGFQRGEALNVEIMTLAKVCETHVSGEISLLKDRC